MRPILPDEIVSDGLGGGSAAKQTDVPDELGGQGQRRLQEISPLHSQVVHLPSSKLPGQKQKSKVKVSARLSTACRKPAGSFAHVAEHISSTRFHTARCFSVSTD